MKKNSFKRGVIRNIELPPHAYHPNVALRRSTRNGYIARPEK